jgi:hypothetical protein
LDTADIEVFRGFVGFFGFRWSRRIRLGTRLTTHHRREGIIFFFSIKARRPWRNGGERRT